MNDSDKLTHAQDGLRVFLQQLSPRDRVALYAFSADVQEIVPLAEMRANRSPLRAQIGNLVAGGGTAVYDATERGVEAIAALHDDSRINAVVVLTDGEDNQSRIDADQLKRELLRRTENEEHTIRVFTIAYGGDANTDELDSIAAGYKQPLFEASQEHVAELRNRLSFYVAQKLIAASKQWASRVQSLVLA